jgi:N-acetylmuramoyl-L-alanine amidase
MKTAGIASPAPLLPFAAIADFDTCGQRDDVSRGVGGLPAGVSTCLSDHQMPKEPALPDRFPRPARLCRAGASLAAALALMLAACAPMPQGTGLPTRWHASPNFDARRIAFVVIHYTAGSSAGQALRTLTSSEAGVSAHYLVEHDGSIVQLVDERARAWHAGASRWGATHDLNSASIGIELDNDGSEPYPAVQIDSLLRLLADLRERHRLPTASFLGHSDVAPRRKVDPGPRFPWATLAARGFGVWCDPPASHAPAGFDAVLGLQAIGYDTSDPSAALGAFRLHYRPWAAPSEPIDNDRHLIHCILARTAAPADPPLTALDDMSR